MKTIIDITALKKDYHVGEVTVHALRGVDLKIREGEFVAIMGASGSGKSTMLNIIGCLDRPTEGIYLLDGVNVAGMSKNERAAIRNLKIGFVFQSYNLLSRTSALENVELPLMYNPNVGSRERREKAMAALEAVGLADRMDHMPNQLSGGQQQRVAIAATLALGTEILVLDESTAELDAEATSTVSALLRRLADEGTAVLIVEQKLTELAAVADRMVLINDGTITKVGSPAEMMQEVVLQHPTAGDIRGIRPPAPAAASPGGVLPVISIRGLVHRYDGVTADRKSVV